MKDEISYGSLQDISNDLQSCVRPIHEMRQALYNALCSVAREVYSAELVHLHLPPVNASGVVIRTFAQEVLEYLRCKGDGKTASMANLLTQLQNILRRYDDRLHVSKSDAAVANVTSMQESVNDKCKEEGGRCGMLCKVSSSLIGAFDYVLDNANEQTARLTR